MCIPLYDATFNTISKRDLTIFFVFFFDVFSCSLARACKTKFAPRKLSYKIVRAASQSAALVTPSRSYGITRESQREDEGGFLARVRG